MKGVSESEDENSHFIDASQVSDALQNVSEAGITQHRPVL